MPRLYFRIISAFKGCKTGNYVNYRRTPSSV